MAYDYDTDSPKSRNSDYELNSPGFKNLPIGKMVFHNLSTENKFKLAKYRHAFHVITLLFFVLAISLTVARASQTSVSVQAAATAAVPPVKTTKTRFLEFSQSKNGLTVLIISWFATIVFALLSFEISRELVVSFLKLK